LDGRVLCSGLGCDLLSDLRQDLSERSDHLLLSPYSIELSQRVL
jgi:hypothetical protein